MATGEEHETTQVTNDSMHVYGVGLAEIQTDHFKLEVAFSLSATH